MKKGKIILEQCQSLIDKFGARLTGSDSAQGCADELCREASLFANRSWIEEFTIHPRAFLEFIRVAIVCYTLALVAYWFVPWVSFALLTTAVVVIVCEFILYKELIDPFFPKKIGLNVVAEVEPTEEVHQQIIVSGHHDSARLFNFFINQPEKYAQRIFTGVGLILLFLLVALIDGIIGFTPIMKLVCVGVFVLGLIPIFVLWRFAADEGSPGAGDNLVGSLLGLEIARYFSQNPLTHTRVVFVSFDAEECGLRGARYFAKKHKGEFSKLPTFCYNMDCIYTKEDLLLLSTDLNCTVPLSKEFSERVASIIIAKGEQVSVRPIVFFTGGTDAAELAKVGVQCASIMAMKWDNTCRSNVYHTPDDTVDAIEESAVDFVYEVGVELIKRMDAKKNDR